MARQRITLRDQIIASAQATMAKGAEHVAILAEIEERAQQYAQTPIGQTDQTGPPDTLSGPTTQTIQADNRLGQAKPDRPTEQTKQTDQSNSPLEPTEQTIESVSLDGQTGRTEQPHCLIRQTNLPDNLIEPSDRTDRPERLGKQSDRTDQPDRPTSLFVKLAPKSPLATPAQKAVFRYFQINGSHVATYEIIANETRVPRGTVRAVIRKMEGLNLLSKSDWWQGNIRALSFVVNPGLTLAGQTNQTDRQDNRVGHINKTDSKGLMKKERRENIFLSQERLESTWPTLTAAGFGSRQIEQIVQALADLGSSTDKIVQSLHHAEWELENGKMLDKTGNAVADPCSWVFRSLARTGYYRKPKGYVSPEEQAAQDAEETARAVLAATQKSEQVQFEAWRAGLSREMLESAMAGYVAGPKEQWLKAYWMKNFRAVR